MQSDYTQVILANLPKQPQIPYKIPLFASTVGKAIAPLRLYA